MVSQTNFIGVRRPVVMTPFAQYMYIHMYNTFARLLSKGCHQVSYLAYFTNQFGPIFGVYVMMNKIIFSSSNMYHER